MKWTRVESEVVFRCRRFNIRRDRNRADRTGAVHEFHLLELRDWVTVVPLTKDERVVMVRQFRHGIREVTLEVPAGILDEDDGSPQFAALRELREETGYTATSIADLGRLHPNPAIQANYCHFFAARDVEQTAEMQWDATEDLLLELVPLTDIPALIRAGRISNALTVAAFHLFSLA